jgi:hypothetical protein
MLCTLNYAGKKHSKVNTKKCMPIILLYNDNLILRSFRKNYFATMMHVTSFYGYGIHSAADSFHPSKPETPVVCLPMVSIVTEASFTIFVVCSLS